MKQVFMDGAGKIVVEDVPQPSPELRPGHVRVQVSHSLISSGTDRALIASSGSGSMVRKVARDPALFRKVYEVYSRQGLQATRNAILNKMHTRLPLGYSCAGLVLACGEATPGIKVGDRVACAGVGFANHAEIVVVPRNLIAPVPDGLSLEEASFVALGAIAQQGIRQAKLSLGESVLVVGLGLVGQLVVQQAKLGGLFVAGADLAETRVGVARTGGADITLTLDDGDAEEQLLAQTGGQGYDAVIVTAADQSSAAFDLAARLVRDRGTISLVGIIGLPAASAPIIGKEVVVKGARSYGPGRYDKLYEERGIDYPINYVRWTENRNMAFFLRAAARGKLNLRPLITHRFAVDEAEEAYQVILADDARTFAVMLCYPEARPQAEGARYAVSYREPVATEGKIRVGIWGLGAFAREAHLPNLASHRSIELVAVGSSDGGNAAQVARRYRAASALTDFESMLGAGLDGLILCGRHCDHARQARSALAAGISVLVEKPLGINAADIEQVAAALETAEACLMLGHNRKYSSAISRLLEALASRVSPAHIVYRIAAGAIARDHWMLDPAVGGGRLVSELSHFTDTCMTLVSSAPVRTSAVYADTGKTGIAGIIEFADGSSASLTYLTQADSRIGKEYLEAHFDGQSYRLDDFIRLEKGGVGKIAEWRFPDKGYREELDAFLALIANPRTPESLATAHHDIVASRLMFAMIESAEGGGVLQDLGARAT